MKAIYVSSYVSSLSDLRVHNIPSPKPTQDPKSQILVNITHSALNHVDLLYARGLHQNNHAGLVKPPFVLGLEYAGIIAFAPQSSCFKVGDHVWGTSLGGFAEQICVGEDAIRHVPSGWSLHDIAGVGAATAPVSYGALIRLAELRKGDWILIHAAAGGLGVVAVEIAQAVGAKVIGTVGSEAKAEVVRKLGVEGCVRYDIDGWEEQVKKISGGKGVDVVYDTVGLVEKSIRCLNFGGCVVIAGFAGLGGQMEKVAMNRVLLKNARLLGYRYGESGRRDPQTTKKTWEGLTQMLESGAIKPVICKTYNGLESVPSALEDLAARKIWGKAVVEINPDGKESSKL